MKKKYYLLLFLTSFIQAQFFPVSTFVTVKQPVPIYLKDFADASTINSPLQVRVQVNDVTLISQQVRLKFFVSGPGVNFQNRDFISGAQPIYLEGGGSLVLTNKELAAYFEFPNLQGISGNEYGRELNEGFYSVCVEVYDFFTNKRISAAASTKRNCAQFVIFQNEPPFLNLPEDKSVFVQQNIQNFFFSWTPRQINVSNVEYEFQLLEIWDKSTNPLSAFEFQAPLYTQRVRTPSFRYGMEHPQLVAGKRYAWRVRAIALQGFEEVGVFKNGGKSQVFWFDYDIDCKPPTGLVVTDVSQDGAKLRWDVDPSHLEYDVKYREKNANSKWYSQLRDSGDAKILNLRAGSTYEVQVGASCQEGKYVYGDLVEFSTLPENENANVSCGIPPAAVDLSNKNPLPVLKRNDVVYAGDYPVVVLNASGSNGVFSGDGYVTFGFLEKFRNVIDAASPLTPKGGKVAGKFSRIKITFSNIGVNTDYKLIAGEIIASYDASGSGMVDGDKLVNDVLGDSGKTVEGTVTYQVTQVIDNPDGSHTLIGEDGQQTTIPKSVNDKVFVDSKGNVITIPSQGTSGIAAGAPGGAPTADSTSGMSSGGVVKEITSKDITLTFENAPSSKYAFDAEATTSSGTLKDTYETVTVSGGSSYKVGYKAISDLNGEDTLLAKATFKNGKTKENLLFKTDKGAAIPVSWTGNVATLTLKKSFNFAKESIIAVVRTSAKKEVAPTPSAGEVAKDEIAGKVNLWHLSQKEINVTLVSVNGATVPTGALSYLNGIFNKAGVRVVGDTKRVTISDLPNSIECGSSDLLNTYTNGQQAITDKVKAALGSEYNDKTYYMLYTGKSSSNGVAGFMPLGRQYGFVFSGGLQTLAHELGHGALGLQHPFKQYNTEKGSTNLLMDYGSGTELSHNDWEVIHSGGWKPYLFQGDSEGEYETDGHYSTVYLVALKLGLPDKDALELAKATEKPDTEVHGETEFSLRGTWGESGLQQELHALNGGFHCVETFLTAAKFLYTSRNDTKKLGELLHRFGDTYAHTKIGNLKPSDIKEYDLGDENNKNNVSIAIEKWKGKKDESLGEKMTPWLSYFNKYFNKYGSRIFTDEYFQRILFNKLTLNEFIKKMYYSDSDTRDFIMYGKKGYTGDHFLSDGSFPDYIYLRPDWYLSYVNNLAWLLSEKYKLISSNFNNTVFRKMTNFAVKNKCKLKGIIDYEIAKQPKQNQKNKFYIPVYNTDGNSGTFAKIDNSLTNYETEAKEVLKWTKLYITEDGIYKNFKVKEIMTNKFQSSPKAGLNILAYEIKLE